MCNVCSVPPQGRPICTWCGKLTWDGLCRGKALCRKGQFFICRECYIENAAAQVPSPEQWTAWFREREAKFPAAFKNGGPQAPSGDDSGNAASSAAAAGSSQQKAGTVKMSCFEAEDDPEHLLVSPPECKSCNRRVWPAMKAKSGKWHCGFCIPPPNCRPECGKCQMLGWDGLSPRGKWLQKGEKFICRVCWVHLDPRWDLYFLNRSQMYPAVYASAGGPAIRADEQPFEGCFVIDQP